jgi:putative transposase
LRKKTPFEDGTGDPKKSGGVVCEPEHVKFASVRDLDEEEQRKPRKERIPVSLMCEVLDVSRGGFYAGLAQAESDRVKEDAELTEVIKKIHDDHEGRLGLDRLVAELATLGRRHSPKRVRRLARAAGLSGVHPRPYQATTVRDDTNSEGLVDLAEREFIPDGPTPLWFTDITYSAQLTVMCSSAA